MKFNIFRLILTTLISLILISCGGGSDSLLVANGGINGTGITMGRITNFGSIFVNGVRFEVDNATFLRDGNTSTGQSEFSVGEYVTLKGSIDPNGTSGIASEVSFTNILEGSVTAETTDNLSIEVLGQTVNIDPLTVFLNFKKLSDLLTGNILEVSGIKNASGIITATSIKLKKTSFIDGVSENELAGFISNVNPTAQTFNIGNLTVEYSNALFEDFNGETPRNGQFIVAQSTSNVLGTVLIASRIALRTASQSLPTNTNATIEGQVTRFVSSRDFDVNGLVSATTDSTQFQDGNELGIALNSFVEIEGTVDDAGVLIAQEVTFKDVNSIIEVTGIVQSFNLKTGEIVLDNQTVVIDASTLIVNQNTLTSSPMPLNDLLIGDSIEIRGSTLPNGNILSIKLTLELKDTNNDIREDLNASQTQDGNSFSDENSISINESTLGENSILNTENIPNGSNVPNGENNPNGSIEPNSNIPNEDNMPNVNNTLNGGNTPNNDNVPNVDTPLSESSPPNSDNIPNMQDGDNALTGDSTPNTNNTLGGGNTPTEDSTPNVNNTLDENNAPTGDNAPNSSIPNIDDNTLVESTSPTAGNTLASNNDSNGDSPSNESVTNSEDNSPFNEDSASNGNAFLSGSTTQESDNSTAITNEAPSSSDTSIGNGGGNFGGGGGGFDRN